jgi:hypothetical protein
MVERITEPMVSKPVSNFAFFDTRIILGILTINVPCFYGAVRNGFEACNIITRGIGRAHPFKCPKSNDVAALKTIKYKRHKNNRYIGSFMYPSAVV